MPTVVTRNAATGSPDYAAAGIKFNSGAQPGDTTPTTTSTVTPPVTTPTVISDSTVRDTTIPQTKADAAKALDYNNNPYYVRPGENSSAYNARITQYNSTQQPQTDTADDGSADYDKLYKSVMGTTPEGDDTYDSDLSLLDTMKNSSDSKTANQIAGIQSQFGQQKNDLQASQVAGTQSANALLARNGGGRSGSGSMLVSAVSRGYIRAMGDVDLQEQQAVNAALQAQDDNDYQLLGKKLDVLKDKRTEKLDLVNKLYDNVNAEKKQTQQDIQSVVSSAAQGGAPKDVLSQIASATDPNQAVETAGVYLQSGTGQVGDYIEYKKGMIQKGLTPLDYGTWKDQDDAKQENLKTQDAYNTSYASAKGSAAGKAAGTPAGTGSGATYNGDFSSTVSLAANAVKGSTDTQRNAVTASLQNSIANDDYPSAWTTIKDQTKNSLSGTNATRFENANVLDSTLGDLKTALQAYSDAGGDTNIFKGTQDQIQTRIGQLQTDPKYASLAVQLDSAYQNYRLMLTGANFSSAEASAYASVLPSKNNSLALNLAKIEGAQNAANSTIDGFVKGAVGQGGIYIKDKAQGAGTAVAPFDAVSSYVQQNPQMKETISNLYKVPGATDQDVWDYIQSLNKQ